MSRNSAFAALPKRHQRARLVFDRCVGRGAGLPSGGTISAPRCFEFMDRASHYRHQADHARQLAEATWQPDLEDILRRLARDFDEIAKDIEADATEIRHLPAYVLEILGKRLAQRFVSGLALLVSGVFGSGPHTASTMRNCARITQ
jgi:hypothetical protein